MEPEIRHIAKTDFEKHRLVRSDGEVTIDGVYPERAKGSYMIRLRVPGGVMTLDQADALARFAHEYANGEWHVDTRANIEFHGVPEAKLLQFVEAIETTGLTTRGACGDSVRNIVLGSETGSARFARLQAIVERLTAAFAGKPEFESLPRKFKIAFYADDDREPLHRINDLGFLEEGERDGKLLFSAWIAGGLGKEPRLADLLFRNVPEDSLQHLVAAAVQLHNAHSNRANRAKARFKHVVEEIGIDELRNLILQRWVPPAIVELNPQYYLPAAPARFDFSGVHAQQDGKFRVRVPIVAGDITGEIAARIVASARAAGASQLQLSVRQNIAIPDVAPQQVPVLVRALEELGFPPSGWFGARDIVACPGATSCRKGFVETHDFAQALSNALEAAPAPAWAKRLRISVSGCPNSCSQPQLFDIGFRGNAGKSRGKVVKGYDLLLGGRLYGRTLLGQQFASLLSQEDVLAAAPAAVSAYAALAREAEPFDALIDRVGSAAFARELWLRVALHQGEWTELLTGQVPTRPPVSVAQAADLSTLLEGREPRLILKWALDTYGDDLLVSSALNAGGVLLAELLREIAPEHPLVLIDTGKLFPETLAYLEQLRREFGLNIQRVPAPDEAAFTAAYGANLWQRDADLCCTIRKVQVMNQLRRGKRAWVSALRREQGGERADVRVLELQTDGIVKVQPLAFVTREWIDAQLRHYGVPQHPLFARGFSSIGCEPCTRATAPGELERGGRWAGTGKTECGLHARNTNPVTTAQSATGA